MRWRVRRHAWHPRHPLVRRAGGNRNRFANQRDASASAANDGGEQNREERAKESSAAR